MGSGRRGGLLVQPHKSGMAELVVGVVAVMVFWTITKFLSIVSVSYVLYE